MEELPSNKPVTCLDKLSLQHKIRLGSDPNAPMILLVHGRAGNFDVMWTFARQVSEEITIIAPQATISDPVLPHSPNGLSWWKKEIVFPELSEISMAAAQKLINFIEEAKTFYSLSPRKIIAVGFSQGAAILSVALQRRPDMFSSLALLCGFVIELKNPMSLSGKNVFQAHGEDDEVVTIQQAIRGANYLRSHGAILDSVYEKTGHKLGTGGMRAYKTWLDLAVQPRE